MRGRGTVLVLEANDMSLTSHLLVAHALAPAEATTPDAPDEVFMVSTCVHQISWWSAFVGRGWSPRNLMPHSDFDPMKLTKLTLR